MIRPTAETTLRSFERVLVVSGLVLLGWCTIRMAESWYVARLPLPPPTAVPAPHDASGTAPPPAVPASPPPKRGSWIARFDAPSVRLSATVLEGADDATLGKAAGHIEQTALPGETGNVGLAGHRDTTFRAVRHLQLGDPIALTTRDRIYHYLVVKTFVVKPEDVAVLGPGERPMMTLVTCYPFEFIGHAPRRYIVQAVLTGQTDRRLVVSSEVP